MKEPGCESKGQARGLGAIDRRDDEVKKSRGEGLTWINLSLDLSFSSSKTKHAKTINNVPQLYFLEITTTQGNILWEFELVN